MAEDDLLKKKTKVPRSGKDGERVARAKSRANKSAHGKVSSQKKPKKNPQRNPKAWVGGGG